MKDDKNGMVVDDELPTFKLPDKNSTGDPVQIEITKPTEEYSEYLTNLMLHILGKEDDTAKRIFEEVGVYKALPHFMKKESENIYLLRFSCNAFNKFEFQHFVKNLEDVFGTDNLDALVGDAIFMNINDLVSLMPEFAPLKTIVSEEKGIVFYNEIKSIIPVYMAATYMHSYDRGPLSYVIKAEAEKNPDLIKPIDLSDAGPTDLLVDPRIISTQSIMTLHEKGYGRIKELREAINRYFKAYNEIISNLK